MAKKTAKKRRKTAKGGRKQVKGGLRRSEDPCTGGEVTRRRP